MAEPTTMTEKEFEALGVARFGEDRKQWKFVCPSCGGVQSWADYQQPNVAKEGSKQVYFNCIGRYMRKPHKVNGLGGPAPCDYTSGGLFVLNKVFVTTDEGKKVPVFALADA